MNDRGRLQMDLAGLLRAWIGRFGSDVTLSDGPE